MTYLLDTNVVSEVRRRRPDPGVVEWLATVASDDLHLSVLTIGELRRGAELLRRRDALAAGALDLWLAGLVAEYGDRVANVDAAVAQRWGQLGVPDPVPTVDGLLAATALARGWTLVTRNTADVDGTGVTVFNPFSDAGTTGRHR